MRNNPKVSQQKNPNDAATTMVNDTADPSSDHIKTNLPPKSAVDLPDNTNDQNEQSEKNRRDLILTHKEAQAGSPDDSAACGEEDPGAGLEFLVTRDDHHR